AWISRAGSVHRSRLAGACADACGSQRAHAVPGPAPSELSDRTIRSREITDDDPERIGCGCTVESPRRGRRDHVPDRAAALEACARHWRNRVAIVENGRVLGGDGARRRGAVVFDAASVRGTRLARARLAAPGDRPDRDLE